MLDQKIIYLLNDQVNKEFFSAYLYLDFSNYYEDKSLKGFANWYRVQAQEERDHALLFYQYLLNNNVRVQLKAIAEPDVKPVSYTHLPPAAFSFLPSCKFLLTHLIFIFFLHPLFSLPEQKIRQKEADLKQQHHRKRDQHL